MRRNIIHLKDRFTVFACRHIFAIREFDSRPVSFYRLFHSSSLSRILNWTYVGKITPLLPFSAKFSQILTSSIVPFFYSLLLVILVKTFLSEMFSLYNLLNLQAISSFLVKSWGKFNRSFLWSTRIVANIQIFHILYKQGFYNEIQNSSMPDLCYKIVFGACNQLLCR